MKGLGRTWIDQKFQIAPIMCIRQTTVQGFSNHYDVVYSVCLSTQFRILCYLASDGTGFTLARVLIYTAVSSHEQL